jgi:hypothetical protein
MELMICCAARLLEDGRTAAVGTGVAMRSFGVTGFSDGSLPMRSDLP